MEETNKGTKNFQKALFTFIAIVFWVYFIINNLVANCKCKLDTPR